MNTEELIAKKESLKKEVSLLNRALKTTVNLDDYEPEELEAKLSGIKTYCQKHIKEYEKQSWELAKLTMKSIESVSLAKFVKEDDAVRAAMESCKDCNPPVSITKEL